MPCGKGNWIDVKPAVNFKNVLLCLIRLFLQNNKHVCLELLHLSKVCNLTSPYLVKDVETWKWKSQVGGYSGFHFSGRRFLVYVYRVGGFRCQSIVPKYVRKRVLIVSAITSKGIYWTIDEPHVMQANSA